MAYGNLGVDVLQSSTAGVPPQFNDGNGTQVGTLCRAWVNFNGTGTVAIRSSFNVSSVTDLGVGYYQVNFTNAMPDANYMAVCSAVPTGTDLFSSQPGTYTTTSVRVDVANSSSAVTDSATVCCSIFR